MSGKDEQPDGDIPICPLCGMRPKFWSLYPRVGGDTSFGWVWFYAKGEIPFDTARRLDYFYCHSLDTIRSVQCRSQGSLSPSQHIFEEDTEVFKEVVKQAKRLENERER